VTADPATSHLDLTITDHGPGISAADRKRVFTRFTRGASQMSGDGTGLGLYVSRQLLLKMSGELTLEPAREGLGATFRITLPGERPGDDS
jgi:signal transduction histidine kinase